MVFEIDAWIVFFVTVMIAISIDSLFSIKNSNKQMSYSSSIYMTCGWVLLAFAFALYVYFYSDFDNLILFLTGYLVELSLSVDNIFIFILIFGQFQLSHHAQHKILMIGIYSAIVLRLIMITAGVYLIQQFQWLFYIFGIILIYAGIRIIIAKEKADNIKGKNNIIAIFKKYLPISDQNKGDRFIIKIQGKYYATHMLIVLILIEKADLIFALDSIPAILSITNNSFLVFTSNIFAILGLRSMYFMLSKALSKFVYIKYALSVILCYIGCKMIAGAIGFHISSFISLTVIILSITTAIAFSYRRKVG